MDGYPCNQEQTVTYNHLQPQKPRVLLAATGCVAALKFETICRNFSKRAEIKAVATKSSLHFIKKSLLPENVMLYTDEHESVIWNNANGGILHIELSKWADIMLIAPLSANTLAKIAGGLCDNLLTCIVRAWDFTKPLYVAPAINSLMWNSPFTRCHLDTISKIGISVINPLTRQLARKDYGNGTMAENDTLQGIIMLAYEGRPPYGVPGQQDVALQTQKDDFHPQI